MRTSIRKFLYVTGGMILLCAVLWHPVYAQNTQEIVRMLQSGQLTPRQAQNLVKQSGLTPSQLKESLQSAGYDSGMLDTYLGATVIDSLRQQQEKLFTPLSSPDRPVEVAKNPVVPTNAGKSEGEGGTTARKPRATGLQPFGYSIFNTTPMAFVSLASSPAPPDYPVGPEDEIVVMIWGEVELVESVTINQEGVIFLNHIGPVMVNGLTLADLKATLTRRLSSVYSGLDPTGQKGSTFLDISLGKLRSIQVFMLGDVNQPGSYAIDAISTVFNALYAAGGPSSNGSMRNIKVLRNNQVAAEVDLYPYILQGDKSRDIRLHHGDIVFVEQVGKRVTVTGEVFKPAIFELRDDESLGALLRYCGGVKTTAYLERMQIDRTIPFSERARFPEENRLALDINLGDILSGAASDVALEDGDVITVFPINGVRRNTVTLRGVSVRKPGTFELTEGMRISDLLEKGEGFSRDTFLDRAHVIRIGADQSVSLLPISLRRVMQDDPDSVHNIRLQSLDTVHIYSIWDFQEQATVHIKGLVRKSSAYALFKGMTLNDLILMAGGLQRSAYLLEAEISRVDPTNTTPDSTAEIFVVPLNPDYRVRENNVGFVLQENDQVFIRQVPGWRLQQNVTIQGEIVFPGEYTLQNERETVLDMIERAGGLNDDAYLAASSLVRKHNDIGPINVDFVDIMKNRGSMYNIPLINGDEIMIARDPKVVKVDGMVNYPVSILYKEGAKLGYYLDRAGGLQEEGDHKRIYIIQPNGEVTTREKPQAGALVMVPQKIPKNYEILKEISSILAIISSAASTIFLISRIN